MPLTAAQARALRLHRDLDLALAAAPGRRFVSGYDTVHPFVDQYLNGAGAPRSVDGEAGQYTFAQDRVGLTAAIQEFHRVTDGVEYAPGEILVSAGSSPLIVSILTWMRECGHRELSYFRPLYHAFYFWADMLRLGLAPLGDDPLWDDDVRVELPARQTVLLLTDPVWFAGRTVGAGAIGRLRDWQERTRSIVIVDGTFQYLKWARSRSERSGSLLRDRTIRLVCPTKSLALHGIRFAYLLGPADDLVALRWICDCVTGSASAVDLRLASRVMQVLMRREGNRDLIAHVQDRYSMLRRDGFIVDAVREPECGYYVFGRLGCRGPGDLLMDAEYFDLSGHHDCVRVNVLSPHLAG